MRLLLSLLAAGALAACAVDDPAAPPQPEATVSDLAQASTGAPASAADVAGEAEDICGLLPCDGQCSLACDYNALLEQYVQPGTCASFYCHLEDGRPFSVDGCRPEENVEGANRRKRSASDAAGG
jgi:hypothetical protein